MNPPIPSVPGWSRRRFWGVALLFFVGQAAVILLLAESAGTNFHRDSGPAFFFLVDTPLSANQLAKRFFAADPTVFALPSRNGFSDHAWLTQPAQQFDAPAATERPEWLALDTSRLGTNFPALKRPKTSMPPGIAQPAEEEINPWPASILTEEIKNESTFAVEGELAARRLNGPTNLPSWPSAVLLNNSEVEIAVDSAGQVVVARLLRRSGLTDADTNALYFARNLRFRPLSANVLTWGRAIFEWQTVELSNAVPAAHP